MGISLTIGTDVLRDYTSASSREWLVTNGIGGYASGSLSGSNTRRYHGLLIAALTPPTGRMTLLSKLEESVSVNGETVELSSNQYPGAIHPEGWKVLDSYENYPAPTFVYRPFDAVALQKRIWMARGENTTFVSYSLTNAPGPVALRLSPLVCWKDYHSEMHPWDGFPSACAESAGEIQIRATADSPVLRLILKQASWEPASYWHYNVEHQRELERGLDFREDLYCPGHFVVTLKPGQTVTLTATVEQKCASADRSWGIMVERQARLIEAAHAEDDFSKELALAADAFVIEQAIAPKRLKRSTIIAGYHWFCDWGRDTMIALPGLCLETGRADVARDILASFAEHVDRGMLPNRFPDRGEAPEYNTVDATLWYFEAIRRYACSVPTDASLALTLWPILKDIIDWHVRGTRYGIGMDPVDGLLRAGEAGIQLTWMDARIGDWVVTPRMGKPVEINALWVNALRTMEELAESLGEPSTEYRARAALAENSFRDAFVRPDSMGLYDVIGEGGPDDSIRPNQIIAASLQHTALTPEQRRAVVSVVQDRLVTPRGLRTLSPENPAFRPTYGGGIVERDSAYHQGTVWPWMIGHFVEAHFRVYGDCATARQFLLPLRDHLSEAGIGSISEIFDGSDPFRPNGCIAQAWSIAEILRAWRLTCR